MFQNKPSITLILLTLALALLLSACQGARAAQINEVVFTARDNSFSGPAAISAGWTQVRLVNEGPEFYHIQLVKLDEGVKAKLEKLRRTRRRTGQQSNPRNFPGIRRGFPQRGDSRNSTNGPVQGKDF